MATLLSIAELKSFTAISATDAQIESKYLIENIEARLPVILNNYFTSSDIYISSTATFNATAKTIVLNNSSEHWEDYGFQSNDIFYTNNSYRNDGYKKILSLSDNILIVSTAYSCINERFNNSDGKIITFSLVNWPLDVKMVAAEMCYYDFDIRPKQSSGIKSRSLGPLSESYQGIDEKNFGYPFEILSKLDSYKLARFS
jgi:hypothetical protein